MPAAGLVAHTLISRFVDHLPYYRQEAINARSGVHTPRSTLGSWSGRGGAALDPLYDAHKRFVLSARPHRRTAPTQLAAWRLIRAAHTGLRQPPSMWDGCQIEHDGTAFERGQHAGCV